MNGTIPNPKFRDFAQRLLAHEAAAGDSSAPNMVAVFRVCEKLRRLLTTFAGAAGFHALLGRALALAKAQVPSLRKVQVNPDGSLEGFGNIANDHAAEAGVLLIAELLGLLGNFIGENLALRLVLDAWPELPNLTEEHHREKRI